MKDKTLKAALEFAAKQDGRLREIAKLETALQMLRDGWICNGRSISSIEKRPSLFGRIWNWYARLTGWEKAALQRRTGLRIRSTAFPAR